MSYRLAVDLGTAFAAAAVVNGSDPVMVGLGNRSMQIPSVLFLTGDETFLVGEAAERRGALEPVRLVREFKRRFGDPVPMLVAGAAYSPESLMARLLRWIVATTTTQQGEAPSEVMLTHPANWGPYKRELLDQVVALAELPGARYCTEPEAAAVRYAARAKVEVGDRIAVYDLGGGTFDVCVLEKRVAGFTVLGTPDGIEHLGGADVDEAVTHLVLQALGPRLEGAALDDPGMVVGLARLRRDCVDAKEALSSDTDVTVPVALPGLTTTVRITRAELEATVRPALLETIAAVRRTLASASVTSADLRGIVLVGGSSRIPLVGEMLQGAFEVPVSVDTHPKHDVALGAALLCRDEPARGGSPPREPETLVPEPLVPEPLVPEPLLPETLVSGPLVPETLVPETLEPEPAGPSPRAVTPAATTDRARTALEPAAAGRTPPDSTSTDQTPPDPTSTDSTSPIGPDLTFAGSPASQPAPGPSAAPPAPPGMGVALESSDSSPRRPARSRRRIALIVGAALSLAVIVGVVIAELGDRPSSSSSARGAPAGAPGTATAQPSGEVSGPPTVAELMSHVPAAYRGTCRADGQDVRGAAVKLACHPTGDPISTVYLWQYASPAEFEAAVDKVFTATKTSDCSSGPGQDRYELAAPSGAARTGILQCEAVTPVITFTSSTDELFVIAMAQATYGSDWGFEQMKGALGHYPLE